MSTKGNKILKNSFLRLVSNNFIIYMYVYIYRVSQKVVFLTIKIQTEEPKLRNFNNIYIFEAPCISFPL